MVDGAWRADFVPNMIDVPLGNSGVTVTIVQLETGGYSLNGEMITADTTHTLDNGATYGVGLGADGTPMAVYIPSTVTVALGMHGGEIILTLAEDQMTYMRDGAVFMTGTVVMSNDREYTVSMVDGTWMAEFNKPMPMVALGNSGMTVTLIQDEAMGWWLDPETPIADGDTYTSGANNYTMTLADGVWTATFAPQSQSVMLGMSGESVMVTQMDEAGNYGIDGMAIESGGTHTSGANNYTLMMAGGVWTATFAPQSQSVMLGMSGESVMVMQMDEAGNYGINGEAIESGGTHTSGANNYTLMMADGVWTATFAPKMMDATLGMSGEMVTVEQVEAGGYMYNGMMVGDGAYAEASNGARYTLVMGDDGMIMGVYMAHSVDVMLGDLGGTIKLFLQEDQMTWIREGETEAFTTGTQVTVEVNGVMNTYTVTMDAETSMWSAVYVPYMPSPVDLGTSGAMLTLTRDEMGGWWKEVDGEQIALSTGDTHAHTSEDGFNGNMYRLTYGEDGWMAEYVPTTMEISGTGLTASRNEDSTTGYTVVGETETLTAAGTGTIVVGMHERYRVTMDADSGELMGTRFDLASKPNTEYLVGTTRAEDTTATPPVTAGTAVVENLGAQSTVNVAGGTTLLIQAGGEKFSVKTLLEAGKDSRSGTNFVVEALKKIQDRHDDLETLIDVLDAAADRLPAGALTAQVTAARTFVNNELRKIFGRNDATTPEDPYAYVDATKPEDALAEIAAVITALSSVGGFQAATKKDSGGILEVESLAAAAAATAFNANKSEATATLGFTGSTRYGALTKQDRTNARAKLADDARVAFAYSTMAETARTAHVQTSGVATYSGGTRAVLGDKLYSGDISIQVRFRSNKVSGLVTNLTNIDTGDAWVHLYGAVESIVLPEANLLTTGKWSAGKGDPENPAAATDPTASITYRPQAGSPRPTSTMATFDGRLLGTGGKAGSEVAGGWSLNALGLYAGFGAVRGADTPGQTTTPDNGGTVKAKSFGLANAAGTLAGGKLTLKATGKKNIVVDLVTEFGRQGTVQSLGGTQFITTVLAEVKKQRGILATLQGLSTRSDGVHRPGNRRLHGRDNSTRRRREARCRWYDLHEPCRSVCHGPNNVNRARGRQRQGTPEAG